MANVSSSNSQEVYAPPLRFPEFNDEWASYRFGDIYTERKESGNESLGILTVSIHSGVSDGELDDEALGKRIKRSEDKSTYKKANTGDLVFNMMRAWQGAIGTVRTHGMVSPAYIVATPNDVVDPMFMDYYVKTRKMINQVHRLSYGVTDFRLRLYWESFVDLQTRIPTRTEQAKIARFLTVLDKRIKKQQEYVDTLKSYKRGALQRLFEDETTISEWQVLPIKDIFIKVSRRNKNGTVKNVITNSAEYGLVPQRDFFDKDIAVDGNTDNYFIIEKGDFVYNPRKSKTAPYGPFNRYVLEDKGIISPLYTCLVLKADINPDYLSWYFKSNAWHRYIYDNGSQGVRHDRVSMTDDLLMGIPVYIPDGQAQDKIAKTLNLLENIINKSEILLQVLLSTKSALLKDMFI